jgi:3-methyladenine DNA glycosylase/8-oxoguanine DNA glycosylase
VNDGYARQLAFLTRLGAYGAVRDADGVTWLAVREGEEVAALALPPPPLVGCDGAVRPLVGPEAAARRVLQLDVDLTGALGRANALAPAHPVRRLAQRFGHIRMVVFADPFAGLCWTVLAQQVSVVAAAAVHERLARAFGTPVEGAGAPRGLRAFPAPARLAAVDPEGLRAHGVSRQKARTIHALAERLAGGWELESLAVGEAREAIQALTAVTGVGRWTAEYVLMRVLGRYDVVPAADAGLRRAWGREAGWQRPATEEEVRQGVDAMGDDRGHVAFWLWLSNLAVG